MPADITEFTMRDYDEAIALWQRSQGVSLRGADSRDAIARYLRRNPGLSFVARERGEGDPGGALVGAVLCGHDGRRGYLHHLAVADAYRGHGVGRALAERCLAALRSAGIEKCHLFVVSDNVGARDFWRHAGWVERTDVRLMSRTMSDSPNA